MGDVAAARQPQLQAASVIAHRLIADLLHIPLPIQAAAAAPGSCVAQARRSLPLQSESAARSSPSGAQAARQREEGGTAGADLLERISGGGGGGS